MDSDIPYMDAIMATSPRNKFPAWTKWAIALALFVLILFGVVEYLNRAADARWRRYAEALRESGLPLTLDEIDDHRPVIPNEQNSALLIEQIVESYGARMLAWSKQSATPDELFFTKFYVSPDFSSGVDRAAVRQTREFLAKQKDLLQDLAPLRFQHKGSFAHHILSKPFPMAGLLPFWREIRILHRLLHARQTMALVDADSDGAVDATIMHGHLGAANVDYPSLVALSVGAANHAMTKELVEHLLRAGTYADSQLLQIQRMLESTCQNMTMKWAWLGSRADYIARCESVANGKSSLRKMLDERRNWPEMPHVGPNGTAQMRQPAVPSGGVLEWLPRMTLRSTERHGVELFTALLTAGDDWTALREAAAQFDAAKLKAGVRGAFFELLTNPLSGVVERYFGVHALLRCAVTGVAAERYRLAHGTFPESVDELVPAFLDAIPIDPFSNRPLLMKNTEDGIVIYSVGVNEVDDGGQLDRDCSMRRSPDIGFRLYHPEHRGIRLIDGPEPQGSDGSSTE